MQKLKHSRLISRTAQPCPERRIHKARCTQVAAPAATPKLLRKLKSGSEASISALAVLDDQPSFKRVLTTSLDKTLCTWTLEGIQEEGLNLLCSKVEVPGGPVFSLEPGLKPKIQDPNTKQQRPVIYCGLAAKEIAAWQPDNLTFSEQVRMNGHTGWVRSMSSSGKYLFSCGCNYLRQWDQAYAVPKEVSSTKLFTGDILAIACGDKRVFTAGADGSLRCWGIGKNGELSEAAAREKAHEGRITALVVSGSLLYSAGYDGNIKAWDVSTLKLVLEVKAAHNGERVQALVLAPGSSSTTTGSSSSSSVTSVSASVASNSSDDSSTSSNGDGSGADGVDGSSSSSSGDNSEPAAALLAAPTGPCLSTGAPASSSPSSLKLLYSGGDDQLVRCWDARLLTAVGEPLQVHNAAVKALAAGDTELLVSGDANGEIALWCV